MEKCTIRYWRLGCIDKEAIMDKASYKLRIPRCIFHLPIEGKKGTYTGKVRGELIQVKVASWLPFSK